MIWWDACTCDLHLSQSEHPIVSLATVSDSGIDLWQIQVDENSVLDFCQISGHDMRSERKPGRDSVFPAQLEPGKL